MIHTTFSTEFYVEIYARPNSGAAGLSSALNVEWDAFRVEEEDGGGPLPWDTYPSAGTLINKNTLDAFKQCDKVGFRFCQFCQQKTQNFVGLLS